MEVQREVVRARGGARSIPINSPVGEPQSNGRAENAVRRLQEQVRTMRSDLEGCLGVRIGCEHPLFPWMVEWAAALITRYTVNKNGKTPMEMIRGRAAGKAIAKFGEKVLYQPMRLTNHEPAKLEEKF